MKKKTYGPKMVANTKPWQKLSYRSGCQCQNKNGLILACRKELVHSLSWIQELLVARTLIYVKPHFTLSFPFVFPFFSTTQCCILILPVSHVALGTISFLFVTPSCYVGHLIRSHWIKFTSILKENILPVILNFTVI